MQAFPQIDGYRITRLIGQGGMARVYAAVEAELEREVAIKVVQLDPTRDADIASRLEFEARSLARLRHPHIVELYRFGRLSTSALYYVMPLLSGGDLGHWLKPVAETKVCALMCDLLDALGHAHQAGIVHRDVKPENILFDQHGRVQLADFGAAFALDVASSTTHRLTQEGFAVGSLGYMSPEQARGQGVTGLSDLYSLAVVAFELLTDTRCHIGNDAVAIALAQIEQPPAQLPVELTHWQAFFACALNPNPHQRYASAALMKAALPLLPGSSALTSDANVLTQFAKLGSAVTSLADQATRQTSLANQATRQTSLADQATRQTSLADQATRATNVTRITPVTRASSATQAGLAQSSVKKWLVLVLFSALSFGAIAWYAWDKNQQKLQFERLQFERLQSELLKAPENAAPQLLAKNASRLNASQTSVLAGQLMQRMVRTIKQLALAQGDAAENLNAIAPAWVSLDSLRNKYQLPTSPELAELESSLTRRVEETLILASERFDRTTAQQVLPLAQALARTQPSLAASVKRAANIPELGGEFIDVSGIKMRLVRLPKNKSTGLAVMSQALTQAEFERYASAVKSNPSACSHPTARACINQTQANAVAAWLSAQSNSPFTVPNSAEWRLVRAFAPRIKNNFAASRECRIQTLSTRPNVVKRTWGNIKSVFGGQKALTSSTRSCNGELVFALDGSGKTSLASPEKTLLVLIKVLR